MKTIKVTFLSIITILLVANLVNAGVVYGNITMNNRPVRGVNVSIGPYKGVTDERGFYRVYCKENGKYKLVVQYGNNPTFTIYSPKNPVKYNFELVKQGGKYILRRR
ncbi:MAG: carboxypeptidase-like regulatory domain-containing protein [Planctomycetes bacterium]|nr:carboxypeptidase-like regulatory domain-containing protein [Planctomycetota bacterium]